MPSKQLALVILAIIGYVQARGYYTITSPGTIRPNSKYSAYVSVSDVWKDTKIRLTLSGPEYMEFRELQLPPNAARNVTFELAEIRNGSYTLEAKGLSGIIFENITNLDFVDNSPSVYLQTDKAMYKFGETIKFRAIFLDQYLLPAKVAQSSISVLIKDAENNKIQQFSNVALNTGVFKGQLQLAEFVVSGMWSLAVFVGQKMMAEKLIEVKEYELPLFEVYLEGPSQVSPNQKYFNITARAQYTFGKPLSGDCLFTISASRQAKIINKKVDLTNGQTQITVNLEDFARTPKLIYINATINDDATLTKRSSSKQVQITSILYSIDTPRMTYECDDPRDIFTYRARVTHRNGTSIDVDEEVYVKLETLPGNEVLDRITYAEGNGDVEVYIECSNYTNINITIQYGDESNSNEIELYNSYGRGGVYVKTQYPAIGNAMEISLISDELFSNFVCVIVGRGNIVFNKIIKIPNGGRSRKHTFSITPTYEMMPKAHIFVYFFKNGKIIYYETTFAVKKQFLNKISIETRADVRPGANISILVDTEPNSYVGLLGMDKSVLLLRSGNDFDAKTIFEALDSVVTKTPERYQLSNYRYPGEIAGLVTMTNANYNAIERKSASMLTGERMTKPVTKVRRNFFETFAFEDFESGDKSQNTIMEIIPETITSWVITGFSINNETGFTLTTTPTSLKTYLPFFVSINLPYSVKVGEIISIPVVVFNYIHGNKRAYVTMETENEEFEFDEDKKATKFTINIDVPKQSTKTVNFKICPKVAGMITLRVSVESSFGNDAIVKKLRVEYGGGTEYKNVDFFISGEESKTMKLDIPQNTVPGSERIEISVMKFIMGSMVNLINKGENFDKLIGSPIGCGEQNMMYAVPNLLVLKYLESTNTSNTKLYEQAKRYLNIGYQRELTYKVKDGSFSTWGYAPGITWLTAYVMRIFHEAKSFIYVDENVLKRGLDFLASKQASDGSFIENGRLTDFAKFNQLSVTASVLLAFLENDQYTNDYNNVVIKALEYVRNNVKNDKDIRAVALCLYVLQLRQDPMVSELLTLLEAKAKTSGDHKWWQYADKPQNIDIYVTSYILLAMIDLNKPVTPIIKWLVTKRNSNGGFSSTLETEVGLRALATYAAKYKELGHNLNIEVSSEGKLLQIFNVTKETDAIYKKIELPKGIREVQFKANGNGKATFQVSYSYNSFTSSGTTLNLNQSISSQSVEGKTLQFCTELNSATVKQTNMVVMEINMPTSHQVAPDFRDYIPQAKKVERSNYNQKLDIYFEGFKKDSCQCVQIPAVKAFNVTNEKPALLSAYEYYEKGSGNTYYYVIV